MINKYFKKKLGLLKESSLESSSLYSKAEDLSALGIDSDRKMKAYLLLKKAGKNLSSNITEDQVFKVFSSNYNNIKNINDAYYYLVKSGGKNIKKSAYINSHHNYYDLIDEEFDIQKWADLVHKIHDAVVKGDMTKDNAVDYYSNYLDIEKDEDVSFKKWFKYYSDGDHLKYSSAKEVRMKKESIYISDLGQGNSPYSSGGSSSYLNKSTGFNMPGDSFGEGTLPESLVGKKRVKQNDASDKVAEKKLSDEEFGRWKSKLHAACRRIDKLLRNDKYLDSEKYMSLAELLMNLSSNVQGLKLAASASDATYRAANTLNKFGHNLEADILKKVAQEVPMPPPPQAAPPAEAAVPMPPGPEGAPALGQPEAPPAEGGGIRDVMEAAGGAEPASLKDIDPIPGARPNEYEELAGDISLDDAALKLDEVAGMLSDRRIIRLLAEFDIMLDKIGIASMFPELAESQSKLIDAFSYALTRVTKMMGQLSNAKTIIDSKPNAVPGSAEQGDAGPEQPPLPVEGAGLEA